MKIYYTVASTVVLFVLTCAAFSQAIEPSLITSPAWVRAAITMAIFCCVGAVGIGIGEKLGKE